MQHKNITGTDNHVIHAYTYADATARLAATGFTEAEVGKAALQQSDNTLWALTDHSPITWFQIGTGAPPGPHTHPESDITGLVADLAGKASAVHNHDDRYYTDAETDTLLAAKSDTTHNHDGTYQPAGSYASATHTHALDDLSDVSTAGATDGQALVYNAGAWAPGTVSGGGGSSPSSATASVRQTVLSGSVDSNGFANFLSAGSGLSVNVAATSTPIVIGFAAGFDSTGKPIDYFGRIAADTTIGSLTANTTCYLYAEYSAGTVSLGHSVLVPVYQSYAPSTPATGQPWFNLSTMTMKVWSGSAWENKNWVFFGEAVTNGIGVTSVITYALRGCYDSGWFPVTINTNYTKDHNLGMDCGNVQSVLYFIKDPSVSTYYPSVVDGVEFYYSAAPSQRSYGAIYVQKRNTTVIGTARGAANGSYVNPINNNIVDGTSTGTETSGYYRLLVGRNW